MIAGIAAIKERGVGEGGVGILAGHAEILVTGTGAEGPIGLPANPGVFPIHYLCCTCVETMKNTGARRCRQN